MQVTPVPLPATTTVTPQQQAVTNGLQHVQVQAVQPITQNAVTPSPKAQKGERAKERRDRQGRERQQGAPLDDHRGENVNISV